MALTRTYLTAKPVSNDQGRAAVGVTDAQIGGVYERVLATANDNGAVIALSVVDGQIMAHPVANGSATVTFTAYENGAVVTGQATVTVTTGGNGKLQAAWSSGAGATIH